MSRAPACVLTCECFHAEVKAALDHNGAEGIEARVFPSRCEARPLDPPGLARLARSCAPEGSRVLVLAGPCVHGAARVAREAREARESNEARGPEKRSSVAPPVEVELDQFDTCHKLLAPGRLVEAKLGEGAFLVTPGWLQDWRAHLARLGLESSGGRELFQESLTRVVLLDSGTDAASPAHLQELATSLGLPHETVPVGLDLLEARLAAWSAKEEANEERVAQKSALREVRRQSADQAMAQDLVASLVTATTEAQAIERVLDLAAQLFAPGALAYRPVWDGALGAEVLRGGDPTPELLEPSVLEAREARCRRALDQAVVQHPSGAGFTLPIRHRGQTVGLLDVAEVAFPEHLHQYVNLSLQISGTCGLAVSNARAYQALDAAQSALEEERNRLAVTLRSIGDGVVSTDCEARVVLLNPAAQHLTGWSQEDAAGRPVDEVLRLISEETRQPVENPVHAVLRTLRTVELANHTLLLARDGTERVIADSAAPIQVHRGESGAVLGVVLVFRDDTARSRMDKELQRVARLESLGLLAGGIAHDFNNLLAVILSGVSLSLAEVPANGEAGESLQDAASAILRARELTAQLLTFARGGAPVRRLARLDEVLRESTRLALSGSNCRATIDLAEDLWPANADAGQVGQVVQNLVLNAAQAMPNGGEIHVEARNAVPAELVGLPLGAGPHVRVAVSDTGPGITPENRARIFDPFFTTKPRGTGLGLSVAFSIIHRHDGHLSLQTELGRGSSFQFLLPAQDLRLEPADPLRPELLQQHYRVLVMDDDPLVLASAGRSLRHLGCQVESARDGAEAVAHYRLALAAGKRFDLALLDLTIRGGMGGVQTLEHLKQLDPSVRAICFSGYANAPVMADHRQAGFAAALPKPFSAQELLEVLHQVFEARAP